MRSAGSIGGRLVDIDFEATRCKLGAWTYGKGASEALLGEVLAGYERSSYVLATKVYFEMSPTDRGLSAAQIHKQIDASLKRLQTDYVDLYQCHRYDPDVPIEETVEALPRGVGERKATYLGL